MDLKIILNSSRTKLGEYICCGYSMSSIRAFYGIGNKYDVYIERLILHESVLRILKKARSEVN